MAIFVYKELHGLHPEQNETPFRKLNELHTHNMRSVTSNNVITYLFLEETLKVFIKQSLTQVAGCGMKSQMRLD